MAYRRHLRCPLLTTHGHIVMLLRKEGTLRRADIAEAVGRADTTVGRLLRELSGEGLITKERLSRTDTWWSVNPNKATMERFANDRESP